MKKLFTLFAVSAAFAVLFSCTKEQDQNLDSKQNNTEEPAIVNPSDGDGFSLTLTMPGTKTSFGAQDSEGYPKTWSKGDQIWVNGKISDPLTDAEAGGSSATFHFSEPVEAPFNVVYPASAYSASGITIPATQTFVSGSFDPAADIILGYGDAADNITLSNAVAYLKIRLTKGQYGNFGVKNIKISSAGRKLNGTYAIDGSSHSALTVPTSTAEESEQSITLDASSIAPLLSDTPVEFLIAVAPQTLNSLSVTVEDMKGNKQTKNKASSTTPLTAGKILAQPAFAFDEYVAIKTPLDLLAFANSCAGDSNYYVVKANIDMTGETWPMAGTGDASDAAFNGVFDGGNNGTEDGGYTISGLSSTTGAFINYLNSNGVVKNVTFDNSCSIKYTGDYPSSPIHVGIVGFCRGTVKNCFNKAPVSCDVTTFSTRIYIGGIVARVYRTGEVTGCQNFANITCAANDGDSDVSIGGVVGALEQTKSADEITMNNCKNEGAVDRGTLTVAGGKNYIGGVIGRIWTKDGKKITLSTLYNTGDVSGPNHASNLGKNKLAIVGGLIGAIYGGDDVTTAAASVEVKDSHVSDCTITNGHWNNATDYDKSDHVAGFIGLAHGSVSGDTRNILFTDGCEVDNVAIISRRGYMGGFASYINGTKVDDCEVLASSVKSQLGQGFVGGGIAAYAEDSIISNCLVKLDKDATTSLWTRGSLFYTGGVAGWTKGTSTIDSCKAYIKLMLQGTNTPAVRGWIVGLNEGALTIKDCWLGGTYGNSTPTITLDGTNFSSYIYGSNSTAPTLEGDQHYWDGN